MALIYDYDEARHTLKYPARPVREEATAVQPKRQRLALSARPVGGGMYLCESSPGLPWRDGQLYLEHDPALAPVLRVGWGPIRASTGGCGRCRKRSRLWMI